MFDIVVLFHLWHGVLGIILYFNTVKYKIYFHSHYPNYWSLISSGSVVDLFQVLMLYNKVKPILSKKYFVN